jgi:hypothetical protein
LSKIVTIHQPDFMPWMGLFSKIIKADELIVLDHTLNNPKAPEFWCRRVKMLIGGKEHWMSVSLNRSDKQVFIPINEMTLNMDDKSIKKFIQSIELNYKKAPFFKSIFYLIENYFIQHGDSLLKKNIWFIIEVLNNLGYPKHLVYSSQMDPQFSSNEMLIDLLKKRGATTYLCGDGASGYQKDELYTNQNILIQKNNFHHPEYKQFNSPTFTKGLSIIDALMNLGFEQTALLFRTK